MNFKNTISVFIVSLSLVSYSQKAIKKEKLLLSEANVNHLDSVKNSFVAYQNASKIDDLWAKEIAGSKDVEGFLAQIQNIDIDKKIDFELPTALLKERLKLMDEKSPFKIEYNEGLENVIKSFLKTRKKSFERLMGISQYYFPIFEEQLAQNNIPLEIKYLAVVESALNPKVISPMGATGLWQFMYHTGKQFGLNINSYVDERSDPIASSKAAAQYLNKMYTIFEDWDLVLAAYNSGPGNVAKAIRRSGGEQNYWNIRHNLPKETQGYLPAFLATMYIFEYHKEHGIYPQSAIANHLQTDTITVRKEMSFGQISKLLDISVEELQFLNPSYKLNQIPHVSNENNFLRLPNDKMAVFTSNETKIYDFLEYEKNKVEYPNTMFKKTKIAPQDTSQTISKIVSKNAVVALVEHNPKAVLKTIVMPDKEYSLETVVLNREVIKYHKVAHNQSISEIALLYNVSIETIKKWNNMGNFETPINQTLKIVTLEKVFLQIKRPINTGIVKPTLPSSIYAKTETAVVDSKE